MIQRRDVVLGYLNLLAMNKLFLFFLICILYLDCCENRIQKNGRSVALLIFFKVQHNMAQGFRFGSGLLCLLGNQGINALVVEMYSRYSGLSENSISSINETPVILNRV